jgi:hypothetical protein
LCWGKNKLTYFSYKQQIEEKSSCSLLSMLSKTAREHASSLGNGQVVGRHLVGAGGGAFFSSWHFFIACCSRFSDTWGRRTCAAFWSERGAKGRMTVGRIGNSSDQSWVA